MNIILRISVFHDSALYSKISSSQNIFTVLIRGAMRNMFQENHIKKFFSTSFKHDGNGKLSGACFVLFDNHFTETRIPFNNYLFSS